MADREKNQQPGIQSPEDYYGQGTGPRHEAQEHDAPEQHGTRTPAPGEDREQEKHPYTIDPTERCAGAILDELPDGDGPRSDAGTNPLPDVYWAAFQDKKPGEE
jgi:hypothetical protein